MVNDYLLLPYLGRVSVPSSLYSLPTQSNEREGKWGVWGSPDARNSLVGLRGVVNLEFNLTACSDFCVSYSPGLNTPADNVVCLHTSTAMSEETSSSSTPSYVWTWTVQRSSTNSRNCSQTSHRTHASRNIWGNVTQHNMTCQTLKKNFKFHGI